MPAAVLGLKMMEAEVLAGYAGNQGLGRQGGAT